MLRECFVDTGDLTELAKTTSTKCIVLGRTGVGKTALLSMLEESEDKVAMLSADDLAVDYLSNSVALKSYLEMGIDLDLFFRVLWRHILVTELINLVGSRSGEPGINYFLQSIQNAIYKKPYQKKAQAYLARYPNFWQNIDVRVMEETTKFQRELDGKIEGVFGNEILGVKGGLHAAASLSREEKAQIEEIGKEVVNRGQIRELSDLAKLLADELQKDRQKRYYIALDRLDEPWTNDLLRYKLIRALIETARHLNSSIGQLKVICAIREDLLDRVFRNTRNHGHQQEKYRGLYLKLFWTDEQLNEVLTRRINHLFVNHYAKGQSLKIDDILSEKVLERKPVDHIISRTLSTPRDVIMYLNECIEQASGKSRITQIHLIRAEGKYSVLRLKSLADEWSADYPSLGDAAYLVKGLNREFTIEGLDETEMNDRIVEYVLSTELGNNRDEIFDLVNGYRRFPDTFAKLFHIFFRVGLLGVHLANFHETYWSHKGNIVSILDISENSKLHIHPAFYRVLSIRY